MTGEIGKPRVSREPDAKPHSTQWGVHRSGERNNRGKRYVGDAVRWRTVNGGDGVPRYPLYEISTTVKLERPEKLGGTSSPALARLTARPRTCARTKNPENLRPKRAHKPADQAPASGEEDYAVNYTRLHQTRCALRKVVKLIKTPEMSFSGDRPRLHVSGMRETLA